MVFCDNIYYFLKIVYKEKINNNLENNCYIIKI